MLDLLSSHNKAGRQVNDLLKLHNTAWLLLQNIYVYK